MNAYIKHIQELSHPNKYTTWYCNIIQRSIDRTQQAIRVQGEKHHIVPRSVCPNSVRNKQNITLLTYKEHFIVHLLLRKMLKDKLYIHKMNNAVLRMCCGLLRGTTTPTNPYASRRFDSVRTSLYNSGIYSNCASKMWVNNGIKSKRVVPDELQQYIIDGWLIGRHTFTRRPSIDITKDGVTKRIDPQLKQQYLLDGWATGKSPRSTVCVTNGTKNIYVEPDNVPVGYTLGSCQKTCEGRTWVTNGKTDVYLKLGQSAPVGWQYGRANTKLRKPKLTNAGRIRVNNGVIQRYQQADDPVPDGWVRGGLSPTQTWTWSKNQEPPVPSVQSPV